MSACNHSINFAAVRAFNRAWHPIDSSIQEAMEFDAAFDAGEYSGPALGRMWDRELNRVGLLVASRFGITTDELDRMVNCALMHEQDVLISKGLY